MPRNGHRDCLLSQPFGPCVHGNTTGGNLPAAEWVNIGLRTDREWSLCLFFGAHKTQNLATATALPKAPRELLSTDEVKKLKKGSTPHTQCCFLSMFRPQERKTSVVPYESGCQLALYFEMNERSKWAVFRPGIRERSYILCLPVQLMPSQDYCVHWHHCKRCVDRNNTAPPRQVPYGG